MSAVQRETNSAATLAHIGIGSNLGDAKAQVEAAIVRLTQLPLSQVEAQSSLFRSAPVDADGDDYINAVVRLSTNLSAQQLLEQLQAIEHEFGRKRPYYHAPRTLDLDLLLYGAEKISSANLCVPHPHLTERAFALLPLLQIDPFIQIAGLGAAHTFASGVAAQKIQKLAGTRINISNHQP